MHDQKEPRFTVFDFEEKGRELVHIMIEICESRLRETANQGQAPVVAALTENTQTIASAIKSFASIANLKNQ